MPVGDFNVGRDVTFSIADGNTAVPILQFSIVTSFDRKAEMVEIKVKGIDGVCRYFYLPDGWKGSIELERAGPEADDFFSTLEQLYYDGRTVLWGQIIETIQEVGGNISQYRWTRVTMKLSDAGKLEGDKSIKIKIDWAASRRVKVNAA